jgi:hypothetical protein
MIGANVNGGVGNRLLRKGMNVQSYSAKSGGSQGANHVLLGAKSGANVMAAPTSAGFNTNDYVFHSRAAGVDPRDKVTMGLGGIIDNGARRTTIQGLSRTTYPELNANVLDNSGTLRAWTPELMNDLSNESDQNGGGGSATAYYSTLEIQNRAAAYFWNDRKQSLETMEIKGGYSAIKWVSPTAGTLPWFADKYCRPHEVQAVCEPDLFWVMGPEMAFEEKDGSMWRFVDRTHTYEAWLYSWRTLASRRFNNHSVLRDISNTL